MKNETLNRINLLLFIKGELKAHQKNISWENTLNSTNEKYFPKIISQ